MFESQLELEFSPDKSTAGYRLHELSVLNWGTFHNEVYTMRPDGRHPWLLEGMVPVNPLLWMHYLLCWYPIGLGTIMLHLVRLEVVKEMREIMYLGHIPKFMMQLLVRAEKKPFVNRVESYTVLLAHFFNEAYKTDVSVAQVLWCLPGGKVDKVYIVDKKKLSIEENFNDLGDVDNIRRIIKERNLTVFDSFTAYHKKFESMLFMDTDLGNRSPMSIFNQAVCIKDVKDLTQFIREHMLDDGGSKEKLVALQERFDDLRSTHRRIETASYQLEQLDEIRDTHDSFRKANDERTQC